MTTRLAKTVPSTRLRDARTLPRAAPANAAEQAADDEQAGEPPVDEARDRVARRRRRAEGRDGHQGRTDGEGERHARGEHQAGHDQEAAADPEEPGEQADAEADAEQRRQELLGGLASSGGRPGRRRSRAAQHDDADDDHDEAEQGQQLLAVEGLGDRGAREGARARRPLRTRPRSAT